MINHPPFAPCIWIEAGQIHLYMPSTKGGLTSHRLTLKDSPEGWDRVRFLITNRSAQSLLGTKGDLTQHQVDRLPKEAFVVHGSITGRFTDKANFTEHARATARDIMRRMGL